MSFTEEAPVCARCTEFYVKSFDDEWSKYCNYCAHERVDDLDKREELVQEVIAAKLVHDERGDLEPLIKAAEKLAGWKP
jgi:hypothetical protein